MDATHLVTIILLEGYLVPGHGSWMDPKVIDLVTWAQNEHGVVVVYDDVMGAGGRRASIPAITYYTIFGHFVPTTQRFRPV